MHMKKKKPAPAAAPDDFTLKAKALLCVCSSLLCTACFPPADLWPLAWVALIPFLFALSKAGPRQSFYLGWLFGFFHMTSLAYWVFYAFYFNSNAGLLVSLFFLIVVVGGLIGLYYALFFFCACRVMRASLPLFLKPFAIACLWVAAEYCRGHFFSGIPWELLGYSQYTWLPIIQIADITGVYGISFLIVLTNCCLFFALKNLPNIKAFLADSSLACILIASAFFYGSSRLAEFSSLEKKAAAGQATVAVIQGSILQNEKWLEENYEKQLQLHLRLSEEALKQGARVLVWPETTIQSYLQERFPESLLALLEKYNASCIIGSPRYEGYAGTYTFYNSAFLVSRQGIVAFHDKMHLLPFGEYFPLGFFDFLRLRYSGPRQYTAGKELNLLTTPAGRAGALLCFEIIFPELVRGFIKQGADLIITISNDAWFGRTTAHYQHFSMAALRAVEFRRPVIRAANTGISGFIDASGAIVSCLAPFTEGYLLFTPAITRAETFYGRHGDLFAGLCFLCLILVFFPQRKTWQDNKK